jgi:hypothetical protein
MDHYTVRRATVSFDISLGIMGCIPMALALEATLQARTVRTTVTLPAELRDAVDRAVSQGKARSRNALPIAALRRELAAQEREEIDAAFASLAADAAFQAESVALAEEGTVAGWEALRLAELITLDLRP